MSVNIKFISTPYGELVLGSFQESLCLCDWRHRKMRSTIDERIKKSLNTDFIEEETPVIRETEKQLHEYFEKERTQFEIPLLMIGTEFQKSIWKLLLKIPYGETDTYLGLSRKIKNEKAIRAVAAANGANAISIIIPCHRIIGSNRELIGYAGGLKVKQKLLLLEDNKKSPKQLQLFDL